MTPRGSGTSGHVQKNAATVRRRVDHSEVRRKEEARKRVVLPADKTLEDHARRRKIELEVQKWARDEDIRGKYDQEEARLMIAAKRRELEGVLEDGEVPESLEDRANASKKRKQDTDVRGGEGGK